MARANGVVFGRSNVLTPWEAKRSSEALRVSESKPVVFLIMVNMRVVSSAMMWARATRVLTPGQIVTVDADAARIYPGIVTELLQRQPEADADLRDAPVFQKLRRILKLATPLTLIDPESPDFQAGNCQTLHDLTRFCHEKAMDAMFNRDVERTLEASRISRLDTELPLNLFILDLGGGLKVSGQETVTEDDIVSRPFQALLRGFHHPGVSWAGQVAPDLKGFISVFANTMYDMNKGDRDLGVRR